MGFLDKFIKKRPDNHPSKYEGITSNIIVAVDRIGAIGANGQLIYNIKEDLQNFKELTSGNIVVMGRATFDSLNRPNGLPNRFNIVISRTPRKDSSNVHWVTSYDDAMAYAYEYAYKNKIANIYIIGGAKVYNTALNHHYYRVDRLIVTHIPAEAPIADVDAWFPLRVIEEKFVKTQCYKRIDGDKYSAYINLYINRDVFKTFYNYQF